MPTPLMNLRVPTIERARWTRAAERASLSLSRWIRDTLNAAVEEAAVASREAAKVAPRRSVAEHRPERVRDVEAYVAAQVAEAEDPAPVVEPPAEEQDPLYRVGRCRDHPNALPRFNDYSRCAWGCRLPPG